jgi:hypothetical protein
MILQACDQCGSVTEQMHSGRYRQRVDTDSSGAAACHVVPSWCHNDAAPLHPGVSSMKRAEEILTYYV